MNSGGFLNFTVTRDGSTSLGDYSNAKSFGKAFNAAHNAGGNGHTFKFNGNSFNTNCADGGNYGQNKDSYRDAGEHLKRFTAHKVSTLCYENFDTPILKTGLMQYNNNISREGDLQRRNYHKIEMEKKSGKKMDDMGLTDYAKIVGSKLEKSLSRERK